MTLGTSKFDRLPKTLKGLREFSASKAILFILIGALFYVGHAAFIPVAVGLLTALVLSIPVEALYRLGLSRGLSAILIFLVCFHNIGCAGLNKVVTLAFGLQGCSLKR